MKSVRSVSSTVVLAAVVGLLPQIGRAQSLPPPDLDNGNILIELIIPTFIPVALGPEALAPGDATLILRGTTLIMNASFDAIAPYHPTAVGVSSSIPRRPPAEAANNRNKNIAILYASYQVCNSLFPRRTAIWRSMVQAAGLNPDDTSTDLRTAVGIGNVAGRSAVTDREHDGMNQLGDEGGRTFNRFPYSDTTGYQPVNTSREVKDPTRWQPDVVTPGNGIFRSQEFVTPQMMITRPYSIPDIHRFNVPPPVDSQLRGPRGRAAYKAQADVVLAISAGLTDAQKMEAEFFNNKLASLGFSDVFVAQSRHLSLDQFVQYDFMNNLAAFDGAIVVWKEKMQWDAVRPFTAIGYVYGNNYVTAWGGVGKGTVRIRGNEWHSYLQTPDHPEYPSGSACFCAAHAQASRRYLGTDDLGWSVSFPAGASAIEPGITPAAPLTLTYPTFTDFAQRCAQSRVLGGVHFEPSVIEGAKMCKSVGDLAFEFVDAHVRGVVKKPCE